MKLYIVFLILIAQHSFSQNIILLKDGSSINASIGSIFNSPASKCVSYKLDGDNKEYHIKYKKLNQAFYDGMVLKSYKINKKTKAFFIITSANGKTLVSSKQTRIKSRGGFESTFIYYEVAVLDANDMILEEFSFTDQKSEKSIETRGKIIPMIKNYFKDCPILLEKIAVYESTRKDEISNAILLLLNDPSYIICKY